MRVEVLPHSIFTAIRGANGHRTAGSLLAGKMVPCKVPASIMADAIRKDTGRVANFITHTNIKLD
ncbi:hypothetical protein SAMN05216345_110187 [Cupriavidus sp. YR651]|nr:hypothetical protein SAMN05216345_110187 [Cupriavidus sp. YR651]